jgi:hypothetical protein
MAAGLVHFGTCYMIVVCVLEVHSVLVLLIILRFYFAEHLSRGGNAWITVSQVLGLATEGWIKDADLADNKTVTFG